MNFVRQFGRTLFALFLLCACELFSSQAFAAGPPTLDVYGNLPGIEDMAISPSGKGLAIVGRMKGERRLIVLDGERKIRAGAPLGDAKIRSVQWIGEESVLLYLSSTEGLGYGFTTDKAELYGAILIPLDAGKQQMVFGKTSSIARAIFGNYGTRYIDGKWQGYFGGLELKQSADRVGYEFDHGRPALFSVDLAKNSPRKIARSASEDHWRSWLVDGNGRVAASLDISSISGGWQITNEQGTVLSSGVDRTGGVSLISFGHDGTSVIWSQEDDAAGRAHWYEVPLAGGAPAEIYADTDIKRIYTDPTNSRMLGYLEDSAQPKPTLFDPAQQAVVRKVYRAFPKLNLEIIQWTPDFSHFLVRTSGNGDSGTWYLVDMAKLSAEPVGDERPLIPPEQVGPISTVSYKAADGLELDGILTLPPGREAKNLPVILFPHGGPHSHDEAAFDWWAQAFASRGYAVFQPNFRGSTNRDTAFRRAGYGQWGRKMQTDISDGLAELAKRGIVDPRRACIVGASYGGYAALAGVTLQNGLYRCAVAVAPVSDLQERYSTENRESGGDKMVRLSLRESLGDPSNFAEVSPRRHASQADAPILLIHGKDDTVVDFHQSAAMADALKDAGKPYELVVLREEDHWLSHAATRKQMLEATMRFVQHHNPAD